MTGGWGKKTTYSVELYPYKIWIYENMIEGNFPLGILFLFFVLYMKLKKVRHSKLKVYVS